MDKFGTFTGSMVESKRRLGAYSQQTLKPRLASRFTSVRQRLFSGTKLEVPDPIVPQVSSRGFVSRLLSTAAVKLHFLRRHKVATPVVSLGSPGESTCYDHFATRCTSVALERSWVTAFYMSEASSENEENEIVLALKMKNENFPTFTGNVESDIEDITKVLDNSSLTTPFFEEESVVIEKAYSSSEDMTGRDEEREIICSENRNEGKQDTCSRLVFAFRDDDGNEDALGAENQTDENIENDKSRPSSSRATSTDFKLGTSSIKFSKKAQWNIYDAEAALATDHLAPKSVSSVTPHSILKTKNNGNIEDEQKKLESESTINLKQFLDELEKREMDRLVSEPYLPSIRESQLKKYYNEN